MSIAHVPPPLKESRSIQLGALQIPVTIQTTKLPRADVYTYRVYVGNHLHLGTPPILELASNPSDYDILCALKQRPETWQDTVGAS